MPRDWYPTKTVEELLTVLAALQDRQINGTITEVAAAGVRTVKSAPPSGDLDTLIDRVLFSLHVKNPAEYPYTPKIKRTRTAYTSG
jgi:ubiquitin-protein ligase